MITPYTVPKKRTPIAADTNIQKSRLLIFRSLAARWNSQADRRAATMIPVKIGTGMRGINCVQKMRITAIDIEADILIICERPPN